MYEKMKLKYRNLICNKESAQLLIVLDKVLTNIQTTLIKDSLNSEEELIKQIYILKGIDNHLYDRMLNDIKNKTLLESDSV